MELDAYEDYLKTHEFLKLSAVNFPKKQLESTGDQLLKIWDFRPIQN